MTNVNCSSLAIINICPQKIDNAMSNIAAVLKRFIMSHKVDYRLYCHTRVSSLYEAAHIHNISRAAVARTVILKDNKGYYVAVLPLDTEIDFRVLNKTLKRELYIVRGCEADRLFRDCEPLAHPPIAVPYGLPVIVDISLLSRPFIYIEPGSHTSLLRIESSDFHYLMANATWAKFAESTQHARFMTCAESGGDHQFNHQLASCVSQNHALPKLPKIAYDIIQLSNEKDSEPEELVELLNQDANMACLLEQYQSFKCKQSVAKNKKPDNGLKHILNFDTISHVVLGVSAQKQLQIYEHGPLGLESFWQHSVLAARLMYLLANDAKSSQKLDPGLCYLGGLLHNFGFLLISNLYQPEFKLLNRWLSADPKSSIRVLERRLLGLGGAQKLLCSGHGRIGAWLMTNWSMPEVVQIMAEHHHNPNYDGPMQNYVLLLMLVNHLLREQGIGEGELLGNHLSTISRQLGIDDSDIQAHLKSVLSEKVILPDEVNFLASGS